MKNVVTVSYPLNITESEKEIYGQHLSYRLAPVKVRMFKNVFITNSGYCLNNKGLIKECHHDYSFQYNDYLNEAAKHYYHAVDNPDSQILLDDSKTYLAIHHPWFNYYHWLCESIFRLWLVRNKVAALTLVLPDYYARANFIVETLEPFNIKDVFYIPPKQSLLVRNLCLPQIKPICDSYDAKALKQVSDFYKSYVSFKKIRPSISTERLYVSRQLAPRRRVLNEAELMHVLSKFGFTVFHPETFTFFEQVAVFSNVKYLVGEHGSGLTNMMFMGENSSVLELHKNKTNDFDRPAFLFWYMANALKINYYHQVCDTPGRENYFTGDYIVDVNLLERNLVKMLNHGI